MLGLNREGGGPVTAGGGSGFTQTDFAKAVLFGLGAAPSKQSINNLLMWQRMEGGNWNNTARFNPLNTSLQLPGSVNYNSLLDPSNSKYVAPGKSGVQAYTSWDQGLKATISTLTGAKADERGYTAIVDALKSGASQDQFLKLLQASSWDAGRYKGAKSSSVGGTTATTTTAATSSLSPYAPSAAYNEKIQSLLAAAANAANPVSNTYNNGPININISGVNDAKKIADQVQQELSNRNILVQTGTR